MTKEEKQKLMRVLIEVGIVHEAFTGRIMINMNDGAVCDVERVERLK